mmetsp:Transcript_25550/g.42811  ORF Transcript_25550/g.42811 Transcript_25550/m.42811 type:complete len:741 (-) Transcript_25550:135-2357(-)
MDSSIIAWVNAFDFNPKVEKVTDLSDGVILYKILEFCEAKHFPGNGLTNDCKGDPQLKERNLQRLSSCMEIFFEDLKGGVNQNLTMDLSKIAYTDDASELYKLIEYVILAAIQSERREAVVQNIISMDQETQRKLMEICEDVMKRFDSGELSGPAQGTDGENNETEDFTTPEKSNRRASFGDLILSAKSVALKGSNEELEAEIAQLREENQKLKKKIEGKDAKIKMVYMEKAEQAEKIENLTHELEKKELEKSMDNSQRGKKNDKAAEQRRNIQRLKHEKGDLMDQLTEYKEKISTLKTNATAQITSMKKKMEKMQDDLDVANSKALDYMMVASKMERYKQKLDELSDIQKQLKDAETAHTESFNRVLQLEDKVREIPTLKDRVSRLKKELSAKSEEIVAYKNREQDRKYVFASLTDEVTKLRSERDQQERKIKFLNEELQASEAKLSSSEVVSSVVRTGLEDDINEATGGSKKSSAEKEKLMRLERDASKIPLLKRQVDAAEEEASKSKLQLSAAERQVDALKEELSVEKKRYEALESKTKGLEGDVSESSSLRIDLRKTKHQLEATEQELSSLKEQLEEVKRQENKNAGAVMLNEEIVGKLKNRNIELRQKLRLVLNQTKSDKKTIERLQENLGRSSQANSGSSEKGGSKLAIAELQRQLKDAQDAEKKMQVKLKSMRENYRKEQLLISNAFYTIGLEAHNQLQNRLPLVDLKPDTTTSKRSWISKQRSKARSNIHKK